MFVIPKESIRQLNCEIPLVDVRIDPCGVTNRYGTFASGYEKPIRITKRTRVPQSGNRC